MQPSSEKAYPAHAFHPGLPNGRASGDLRVSQAGFEFVSGEHVMTAPLAGAQLKLGGASDRLVFLTHPHAPEWSIYTSDRSILDDPALTSAPELTGSLRTIRMKRANAAAKLVIAAAVVLGAPLALLANMGSLTALAARQIPPSWEETLGEAAYGQYRIQAEMIEDARTAELLRQLTDALTGAMGPSPYTFRFHVARNPALNAFALPGGYIVMHSELILRAQTASELLGVLAHEMAHVTKQHGTRNLIASAGAAVTIQALLGDASGLLSAVATAAPFLLTQKYSRGFEREADREGFELLQRAGVDATGMLSFFEKVKAEEEKAAAKVREELGDGALLTGTPEFLSTHPAADSRIEAMRELVERQSGARRSLDSAFLALKAHIQELENQQPGEQNR
jgi:beta-barrel assembly-enhancing protease